MREPEQSDLIWRQGGLGRNALPLGFTQRQGAVFFQQLPQTLGVSAGRFFCGLWATPVQCKSQIMLMCPRLIATKSWSALSVLHFDIKALETMAVRTALGGAELLWMPSFTNGN